MSTVVEKKGSLIQYGPNMVSPHIILEQPPVGVTLASGVKGEIRPFFGLVKQSDLTCVGVGFIDAPNGNPKPPWYLAGVSLLEHYGDSSGKEFVEVKGVPLIWALRGLELMEHLLREGYEDKEKIATVAWKSATPDTLNTDQQHALIEEMPNLRGRFRFLRIRDDVNQKIWERGKIRFLMGQSHKSYVPFDPKEIEQTAKTGTIPGIEVFADYIKQNDLLLKPR